MNTVELEVAWEIHRACILWFGPYVSNTRFTEVLNIYRYGELSILTVDKF